MRFIATFCLVILFSGAGAWAAAGASNDAAVSEKVNWFDGIDVAHAEPAETDAAGTLCPVCDQSKVNHSDLHYNPKRAPTLDNSNSDGDTKSPDVK